MSCPACLGADEKCPRCGGLGELAIDGCPRQVVPAEAWEVLEMAEFLEQGLMPVAGGMIEQAKAFVTAARFVWAERDRIKAARSG